MAMLRYSSTFYILLLACTLAAPPLFAQQQGGKITLSVDKLGSGIDLGRTLWRYHPGDDPAWSDPSLNDADWSLMVSAFDPDSLAEAVWPGIGWFRLHLRVDSMLQNTMLALSIYHLGASDIYLDGQRLGGFGEIDATAEADRPFSPKGLPLGLYLDDRAEHVLAVRYANRDGVLEGLRTINADKLNPFGFAVVLAPMEPRIHSYIFGASTFTGEGVIMGILILLSFLHLMLFLMDRREQANLYFSLYALFGALTLYVAGTYRHAILLATFHPNGMLPLGISFNFVGSLFLIATLHSLFYKRLLWPFWVMVVVTGLVCTLAFFGWTGSIPFILLFFLEMLRVIVQALRKKKEGAWIITTAILVMFLTVVVWLSLGIVPSGTRMGLPTVPSRFLLDHVNLALLSLSMPVAMSVLLARRFVQRSKRLERELVRVEELSAQTLAQEREKQALIASQKERLEVEVAERTSELKAQAEQLQSLDEAKSRFFANISHEFRTPLTLILGPLEDLRDGVSGQIDGTARGHVDRALRSGRRLLRLVNQLLDVARLEHGRIALQARRADLGAFVRSIEHPFRTLAERKRIAFAVETPAAPLPVYFDAEQVEKILANLLGNAFKFTPAEGRIELTVCAKGDPSSEGWAVLSVHDSGPGIAPEHLPMVFDRFYQADASSTRRQPGTGIGLALVKSLVDLHHGRIEVESAPEAGSTFTVRLPLGRAHLTDDELVPDDAVMLPPEALRVLTDEIHLDDIAAPTTGEDDVVQALPPPDEEDVTTVLVVDDNADMRAYVRRHLETRYRVIEAVNGRIALEQARTLLPDLIVSDVMMPELDGYGLCRALKADPELDFIPVILLTAKASEDSLIAGLEEGADAYVTKPFSVRELGARVDQLIAKRHRLKERLQALAQGDGLVDPAMGPAPSEEEAFLAEVRRVIAAHVADEGFGVEDLVEALGVGRSTLYRRLEGVLEGSPKDLIWQVHLERAAQLFETGAGSVSEVGYAVGFRSMAHFSRRFRRQYGLSPSAYAAQHRPTV